MLSSSAIYRLKHMARIFILKGQKAYWFFGSMHGVKILIQLLQMTSQAKNCHTWRCYIALCSVLNPITT